MKADFLYFVVRAQVLLSSFISSKPVFSIPVLETALGAAAGNLYLKSKEWLLCGVSAYCFPKTRCP